MHTLISTKSEEWPLVNFPSEQPVPASSIESASHEAAPACGFLKVMERSPTYIFVEALEEGSFWWVFSSKGRATSVRMVRLLAGQRAQAYATRSNEQVGIRCC